MKTYTLRVIGRSGHAAALAARCAVGQLGESLVRNGITKEGWNDFILSLITTGLDKGIAADHILAAMNLLDAGNASASRQAIKDLIMVQPVLDKDGKPVLAVGKDGKPLEPAQPMVHEMTVEAFWASNGGAKASVDLSKLTW